MQRSPLTDTEERYDAVCFGLGEAKILPEPAEHIFEWGMWFTLLAWYFTFRCHQPSLRLIVRVSLFVTECPCLIVCVWLSVAMCLTPHSSPCS